jgi:transposase
MSNRLLPVDHQIAKNLKAMLPKAKNSIETKRITIMVIYMWWANIPTTKKILKVSSSTVENTVKKYIIDQENFYKTNLKGRQYSDEKKVLLAEISELVKKSDKDNENIDIPDVNRIINKRYWIEKLDYHQTRSLVRSVLKMNYQKPFVTNIKKPTNAEEILMERFTEAVIKVWLETNTLDEKDILNKKTKFWVIAL